MRGGEQMMTLSQKYAVTRILTSSVILLVSLLTLSACQSRQEPVLTIAGSRSVLPVIQEIADIYGSEHPEITIDVHGIGSSAGIESVRKGTADIGMASRGLKEEEQAELVGAVIALDVVAIIVHRENAVSDLTTDQVRSIFSSAISHWSEVGGDDLPIVIIDKEAGSGTREVFEELLMGEDVLISESAIVMDGTAAARTAVASDPAAIGYISLASVTPEVRAISLDGITPSVESVQAGRYSLFRPFVLATRKNPAKLATQFIEYVRSTEGQDIVEQAGLIRVR
jgi:phosphate transport system substrate-binding protein